MKPWHDGDICLYMPCVDFLDMFFEDMAIFSTRVGQKIDTTLE